MGNEGILEEERQEHSPRDRHMPENQGPWSIIVGHHARKALFSPADTCTVPGTTFI